MGIEHNKLDQPELSEMHDIRSVDNRNRNKKNTLIIVLYVEVNSTVVVDCCLKTNYYAMLNSILRKPVHRTPFSTTPKPRGNVGIPAYA